MKDFLALIPARDGSIKLKNKNFLAFNKQPLIYWTIKAAKKSKFIDEIIVSSDSKKILNYCKKFKKLTTLIRPKKIARSGTKMIEVAKQVLKILKKKKKIFKYLIILQPTSPLRDEKDIDKCCSIILKNNFDSLVSIEKVKHNYYPQNLYNKKKFQIHPISKKQILKNRQTYQKLYARNGAAIYITKSKNVKKFILGKKTAGYVMPEWKSVDINNVLEFKFAEFIMKNKSLRK